MVYSKNNKNWESKITHCVQAVKINDLGLGMKTILIWLHTCISSLGQLGVRSMSSSSFKIISFSEHEFSKDDINYVMNHVIKRHTISRLRAWSSSHVKSKGRRKMIFCFSQFTITVKKIWINQLYSKDLFGSWVLRFKPTLVAPLFSPGEIEKHPDGRVYNSKSAKKGT